MTQTRTNNFDGIRIIAASMVIIGHAYGLTGNGTAPFFWQYTVSGVGIKIFFAISGYLVVKSFMLDPHFGRFLAKRTLRIFPALITLVIVSACILGPIITILPLSDYFSHPDFSKYFQNIALIHARYLPGVFETTHYPHEINGPLWSLAAEFFMYLSVMMVAALSLIFARKNRIVFEIIWTIFTLALIIIDIGQNWGIWDFHLDVSRPVSAALFFGVGGMIFLAERYTTRQIPVVVLIAMAILLQIDHNPVLLIVSYVFTPIIIIRLGHASWPVLRDLGRWGDLSYGTYLYGWPVAQVLIMYYLTTLPLFAHIVLALLISYVLGFFSWHLVEKRALRLKPKKAVDPAQQG